MIYTCSDIWNGSACVISMYDTRCMERGGRDEREHTTIHASLWDECERHHHAYLFMGRV